MYEEIPEKKIKLLLVEDEELYRISLRSVLESDPSFIVAGEAENGKEAVTLTEKLNPDVVLMDLGLPVMNGIQATRKIKENNPNTKIIELTGNSDENEAMLSLLAGANAYIRKEIAVNYLKMIIHTVNNGAIWIDPLIGNKVLAQLR